MNIGEQIDYLATVNTSNNTLTYSWDYGDGTISNMTNNTSHRYETPGIYTVTLTVRDTVMGLMSQASVIVETRRISASSGSM